MAPDGPLGPGRILRFYLPLVAGSLLATLTGPVLNAALGRSADPTRELAGFWIAFTVVLFVQGACQVLPQVTLVLAGGPRSLPRLAAAAAVAGGVSSALVHAVARTPLAGLTFGGWIPTAPAIAGLAADVLADLAWAPLLIAARGLAAGIALRGRRSRLVAGAAALRLAVIAAASLGAAAAGAGARGAAWAFLAGTAAEALWLLVATRAAWSAPGAPAITTAPPAVAAILRVASPLAAAAFLWTATRPVIHAVLGRLDDPVRAQAAFGIVLPVLLVTCSPLWPLQDVVLALGRDARDVRRIVRFALATAAVASAGLAAAVWTPAAAALLRSGFGLAPGLEAAVAPALVFLAIEPWLLATRAVLQGLLSRAGRAGVLLVVPPVRLVLTAGVGLAVADRWPATGGAALGLLLILGGDLLDVIVCGLRAVAVRAAEVRPPFAPLVEWPAARAVSAHETAVAGR